MPRSSLVAALFFATLATTSAAQEPDASVVRSLAQVGANEVVYDAAGGLLVMRGNIQWSDLTILTGEIVCDTNSGVLAVIDHTLQTDDRVVVGTATCNALIDTFRGNGRLQ